MSHGAAPAHKRERGGHLLTRLVPDLLVLPALRLHRLRQGVIGFLNIIFIVTGIFIVTFCTFNVFTLISADLERNLLGLVLALLPVGRLALVRLHLVLGRSSS